MRTNANQVGKITEKKSYVPQGLTAAQYNTIRAEAKAKKDANYRRNVAKAGVFEDYTDFYLKVSEHPAEIVSSHKIQFVSSHTLSLTLSYHTRTHNMHTRSHTLLNPSLCSAERTRTDHGRRA